MLSSQRNNKGNSTQFFGSKAMKGFLLTGIFLLSFFHGLHSQSISVSGTSSVNTIIKNVQTAVDPGLLVTSDENITNFTVTIIDSYQSGDALGYTGSLPSGVTASIFNTATKSIVFTGTLSAAEWQQFLRRVTLITANNDCLPERRKITFVAGETYFNPFNNHFYRPETSFLRWSQSKTKTQSVSYYGRQGYLVTIGSAAENNFVSNFTGQNSWAGGSDDFAQINEAVGYTKYANQAAAEGKYHWVTGPEKGINFSNGNSGAGPTTVTGQYANWANGEPNNCCAPGEDYLHFYAFTGLWNDFYDSQTIQSIYEFGDMPNDNITATPLFTREISVQGASSGRITGGEVAVCSGTNSTTLTLTNLTGTVVRWESSFDNFLTTGTTIVNTTTTYTATNLTRTTYFRAVVNPSSPSGCTGLVTASTKISVTGATAGNILATGGNTICVGGEIGLVLSGNSGTVSKWQKSIGNNTSWTDVANTTINYSETLSTIGTYYYRAVVTNTCGTTTNSDPITVTVQAGTPPVGGSVSNASHTSTTNSGTLTLSGHTGTIQKWQYSDDNGVVWVDVTNTTTSLAYTNVTKNRLYRVRLQNGSCGSTFSAVGQVSILTPSITVTSALTTFDSCGGAASSPQTVTISGANLSADIAIAAVTGFQYSLDGTTYSSTLTIPRSGSSVASTTVSIRLAAAATGSPSGIANITSTGATTRTLSLNGTGTPSAPSGTNASRTTAGTLTLTATVTSGNTVDWYAAATGGSPLASGNTSYTTPSISQTTVYYAEARNSNSGCVSATRTAVTAAIVVTPVITSFTPTTAGNGETVVITGTGLSGVTVVKFGNVNATSFTVNSDTQITAIVGAAASGDILVQNSAGSDTEAGFVFKIVEYKFENNVLDETNANLDGTISGNVTYGTGVEGRAVCFDRGSNNWVVLPNNLIRNLSDFTISMRFKTTSKGVMLGYQNVAANGSANEYIPILVVQSNGTLRGTLWTSANRDMSVVSSAVVNDGNWHRVDMSITPTSINIYLDGTLVGSNTSGTVAHLSMQFNQLGRGRTDLTRDSPGGDINGWQGFTGCIDNFVILDKGQSLSQINQSTAVAPPTITAFAPTTAKSGETVVITGTNLSGTSAVKIGGVDARSFTAVSATEIRAIVGKNATVTTNIEVTAGGGSVTGNTFTFDCTSNALDFDGVNDYVTLGDNLESFIAVSQEAWVYWKGSSQPYSEIFSKEFVSTFSITSDNKLHANFGTGSAWQTGLNSTTSIPLNKWTHVAITRSVNGLVKLYINGVLENTTANLNASGLNALARGIGAKPTNSSILGYFNGSIDELKVWSSERTQAQVASDLSSEAVGNEPGLLAYYNFNQGTAGGTNTSISTLSNLTVSVNFNGTLTNFAGTGTTSNLISRQWPVIITEPAATASLCVGQGISVSAVGEQLTYQWYSNTSASTTGGTAISGATSATFTIPSSATGTNYYYVVVSGACSQSTTSTVSTVTVVAGPEITYTAANSIERTFAITAITPTVSGGTVASYSISPALPTGLVFNTTTGVITGTPTVNSTSRTYTVSGTTASGCVATATFTLEVFSAVAPSALSYSPATQTVRQSTAITAMTPTVSGGAPRYTISPALPAGLSINASTGVISGTLAATQTGSVTYTVTATNSGGTTTATVTLVFNTAPTNIGLTPAAVAENSASGTTVGTLSATDADTGDTFTYTLVSGTGSTDNSSFSTSGSSLKTAAVFDFETKTSYSVRVRVTDAGGLTFEKAFTITVTDVNEDRDGDGVKDNEERADGTDPLNACSFNLASQNATPSDAWKAADCDEDGLTNQKEKELGADPFDADTDGDGVPDGVEEQQGTNPNDSKSAKDTDGDGVPDYVETVLWPNQGLPLGNPNVAGDQNRDTDKDGVPDYQEFLDGTNPKDDSDRNDSDGDGVPDYIEVQQGTNPNDPKSAKDTDGDGVPDYVETVVWPNQGLPAGNPNAAGDQNRDTDKDGVPDYQEILNGTDPTDATDAKDSDGDGVPDYVEQQQGTNPNDSNSVKDTDGDGIPDYVETVLWPNQGLPAGNPNVAGDQDRDTDGDGVPDYVEVQQGTDPKNDKDSKDSDGDGVPDYIEIKQGTDVNDPDDAKDTDGDGVPDYVETVLWPNQGIPAGNPNAAGEEDRDTDGDGVPDYQEVLDGSNPKDDSDRSDSDGDGVPDYIEEQQGTDPNDPDDAKDTDGDGVPDYVETVVWPNQGLPAGNPNAAGEEDRDSDGDGVSDYQEVLDGTNPKDDTDAKDSDGDGVPDAVEEEQGTDPNDSADAKDTDGDGIPDYVETVLWPNLGLPAGNPNAAGDQDRDTDGDGVPDYVEVQQGTDPKNDTDAKDSDGDGVPDYIEIKQGTDINNPDDAKDSDGDGVPDYVETVLWPNQGLPAGNPNAAGDQDRDTDGDGVPDYQEVLDGSNPKDDSDRSDSDGDGVPDYIEEQQGTDPNDPKSAKDTDGDGVPDYVETVVWPNQGLPAGNPNAPGDQNRDTDGDGVPDYIEVQQGTDPKDDTDAKDSDGDGVPDFIEIKQGTDINDPKDAKDADGDGVPDYVETVLWPNQGLPAGNPNAAGDQDRDTDGDGVPDYVEVQQGTDPKNSTDFKDSDGDGVPDYIEIKQGTDINDPADAKDTDGDGVPDYVETVLWPNQGIAAGNPNVAGEEDRDSDGDGVPDYQEVLDGTNPKNNSDRGDSDGDGVPDYIEIKQGTDINDPKDAKDTDGDGVPDYVETVVWPNQGLPAGNPNAAGDQDRDTDGDGVPDYIEVQQGTDPKDDSDAKDSDGDGVPDYIEILQGTDINDPNDAKDTDGDGVPDYVETVLWPNLGLPAGNPNAAGDQDRDTDGDGVPDYFEILDGTNASDSADVKDSDGDGVPDYLEQLDSTDINNPRNYKDTDKDVVPDFVEVQQGTSPSNTQDFKDSDGDGIPDYVEIVEETDLKDPSDFNDSDGDGVPDYVEIKEGTNPNNATDLKDSDKDGVADYIQFRSIKVTKREDVVLVWGDKNYRSALPKAVEVTLFSGAKATLPVVWNKTETVNILKRGTYELTGTIALAKGVYNPYKVTGIVRVVVLPKPAPRDVTIDNSTFAGSTTVFFIGVGSFAVNDPVDNIHVVSFLGDGYDNKFFFIKDNVLYWNSAERAPGKTTFSIVIRVTDRDGNTLDKFFTITRTRKDFSSLTITNAYSPNGDGVNDAWGVPELRFYEGVRISIYDRGGLRLFYTENPDIRWDGTYNGKEMPVGTYFWTIEVIETGEMRRGMLNLIRK